MTDTAVIPGKIHDAPIRRVHSRGSHTITGIAFLTKAPGGMAHALSTNESQFVKRAAVDPRITEIRAQPLLLRYHDANGLLHDAFPDFVILIDGEWEVHEVKPDREYAHPDVRDRLRRTADAARREGLGYSVALASTLFRKTDRDAVEAASRRVGREIHPIRLRAIDDALAADPLTADALLASTGAYGLTMEDVHGALAAGRVRADMTTRPDGAMLIHHRHSANWFDRLIPFLDPRGPA